MEKMYIVPAYGDARAPVIFFSGSYFLMRYLPGDGALTGIEYGNPD
jgi:hypothetical protein